MANFNPLSSSVSFDDLLKANKQQFDRIFSAQTQELGLLDVSHRPRAFFRRQSLSIDARKALWRFFGRLLVGHHIQLYKSKTRPIQGSSGRHAISVHP